ncbi:kelch domain-containing protein 1 [Poecilia formosa]|uniref:kelch domain-containing protein 1 n=1 Tax=Poecilia formosa TaxID=48698 RepID=UPI0007B97E65|nr:PREDICTED: kelch domain-containing protein 1 [Poecilia formosa]
MDPAFERHCSELVARERSGHTAVVLDSLLYVWGGYMSIADEEVFIPSDEIWVYDLEGGIWFISMLCCSSRLIYFGGYGHKVLADITSRSRNFIPDETSWVDDLFWGWNNEVHVFDPVKGSWAEPQTHGRPPAPRAAHAGATLGRRGYVCGGRVMETRTNDLHSLDLESWTWTEIVPSSAAPVGRSWHTVTAVSESTMFLFGGLSVDCRPMSDGWLFDVETKKWREFEHPYQDKPRLWHTACGGRDSDVVVFGGSCDYILLVDTGHCNDALVFQMQPHPLFRICEDYIAKNVRTLERLRKQLPLLPPKMLKALQRRISFYRPSKKQSNN